ncbi:hypothetical protein [Burkholderia diffusa]|uniref:hypothetical protein n=1 Tax=Burkholderia diffusa TaxID=488732 RepID=UPI00158EAECD|nr:hypothetical protein [Burkholderia diffusa]
MNKTLTDQRVEQAKEIVADWIKGRGTYLDGEAYGAAVELVAFAISRTIAAQQPEPRAEVMDEQPSLTNPLTPYGMLVRALRIVTGTLLYDMAKSMSLSPATLSAMEVGHRPVTYADACGAADFFASRGISGTLSALEHAIDAALAGEGQ